MKTHQNVTEYSLRFLEDTGAKLSISRSPCESTRSNNRNNTNFGGLSPILRKIVGWKRAEEALVVSNRKQFVWQIREKVWARLYDGSTWWSSGVQHTHFLDEGQGHDLSERGMMVLVFLMLHKFIEYCRQWVWRVFGRDLNREKTIECFEQRFFPTSWSLRRRTWVFKQWCVPENSLRKL